VIFTSDLQRLVGEVVLGAGGRRRAKGRFGSLESFAATAAAAAPFGRRKTR